MHKNTKILLLPVWQEVRFTSKTAQYQYLVFKLQCVLNCNSYALTLRVLMSYIYGAPILDVSRSHTTTQHSR